MYRKHFSGTQRFISPTVLRLSLSALVALVSTYGAAAQDYHLVTPVKSTDSVVSVRELGMPDKARQEFTQGLKRLNKRDWQGSVQHFDNAIAQFSQYYEAYYHKGLAETQLKDYDAALESFQSAIDISEGKYPRAQFGYGLVLCREGRAREAEGVIRHGLESAPNLSDGYVVLGLALLRLNRLEEAEKVTLEGLRMSDSMQGRSVGKGYLVLADIHSAKGDYLSQVHDLNTYLKLNPGHPDGTFIRAARDAAEKVAERLKQSPQ